MEPRQAIARGLVAAVMQTGGLLKDLTVRETVQYTASLFADTKPVDEVLESAGITGDRRPQGRQVLGRRAAAAPVRDGAALRPGAAAARRADHRHGRRGPPLVLVRDPRGRRAGPHGAVRDALPRGGRPVRRPDRADQPRPDRRRRHRQRDQGARLRPHRPRHAARRRHRRRSSRLGGVDGVEVRGDQVYVHAKDSDAVARYLLTETDARDLEITAHGPRGRLPQPDRRTPTRRPTPTEGALR